jgi:hypothetical protein
MNDEAAPEYVVRFGAVNETFERVTPRQREALRFIARIFS